MDTYIWNLKDGADEFIFRAAMENQTYRTDLWLWREGRRERMRCMERVNMETYNTICKIDNQWEFAVWFRELKQGLCDNLEGGWKGRWEGGLGGRGHGCTYGWFLLMFDKTTKFCKAIFLQLKNKSGNKIKIKEKGLKQEVREKKSQLISQWHRKS